MGRIDEDNEEYNSKYDHFTHDHPLEPKNCGQQGSITCSGCNKNISEGKDFYTCKDCSYVLHRVCFNMARIYSHAAEPGHDLNLQLMPSFECKACGLQSSGFCYNCRVCDLNYEPLCLRMPLLESSSSHGHLLRLVFCPPCDGCKGFCCDVCGNPGSDHWLHRCNQCEFYVHLNCVYAIPSQRFLAPISAEINDKMASSSTINSSITSMAINAHPPN